MVAEGWFGYMSNEYDAPATHENNLHQILEMVVMSTLRNQKVIYQMNTGTSYAKAIFIW